MRSRSVLTVVMAVAAVGCGASVVDESNGGPGTGAATPQATVQELVDHLEEAEFNEAAALSFPNHAELASLAEGASFSDVAGALRSESTSVSANFWAGFAQGSATFLDGDVAIASGTKETRDGIEFSGVVVTPDGESDRTVYTREANGWRIDVFASFGAGLASRMIEPTERLLVTLTEDAELIRSELRLIIPSLYLAAADENLPPKLSQDLLKLIEIITRIN